MTSTYAVTTEGESLWIKDDQDQWVEVKEVTAGPAISGRPEQLDATHLKCPIRVNKPGIRSYSGDLVWTCNAMPRTAPDSNVEFVSKLRKVSRQIIRKLPQAGYMITLSGTVYGEIGASTVNAILPYTVTVVPDSDYSIVALDETYTITYSANGGTGTITDAEAYEPGEEAVVKEPTGLSKEGSTFLAWNTSADGKGRAFSPGESITMYENRVLYAIWLDATKANNIVKAVDATTPTEEGA